MSAWLLILRSLRHYWRTHLGVLLGALVSTAVLVGALAVGDSVRHTLRSQALARLGEFQAAMDTGSRLFTDGLAYAPDYWVDYSQWVDALRLRAIAISDDGSARANNVQLLGVSPHFWSVARVASPLMHFADDQVVLNQRLAAQLGVHKGDEVLLRVDRPSVLSRDAPLMPTDDASVAMRLTVAAVATDAQLGRFSLQANQVPPYNAFLSLFHLQKKLGLPGRANLLLTNRGDLATEERLRKRWGPDDIGVKFSSLSQRGATECRTDRVFLDPPVGAAALKAFPNAIGVLTYFVNELRVGNNTTPYSTVTAIGPLAGGRAVDGLVPSDMANDEVVINTWLGGDLGAKPGDELEMTYFVVGPSRKLVEQKTRFRIRAMVPIKGTAADWELMPNFPGVADVDNCRDWKPGIPIDLKKIRPKDEDYWKQHRGTPKAFITLAAGQKIWANRFGNLTAIRFYEPAPWHVIEKDILDRLNPSDFGLVFRPVREEALKATTQGMDFGQLFLGLSFFLIAAAVLLMGLLFVFGIEQRAGQVGLLLALGFTPRRVRRLMMAEGTILAILGGIAGTFAGTLYTRAVLAALAGVWRGAVAGTAVQYHAETTTLLMGGGIGLVAALAAMWLTLRRQARRPARELLTGSGVGCWVSGVGGNARRETRNAKPRHVTAWLGLASIAGAIAIVIAMGARRDQAAAMGCFGAGGLLLVGGLALCYGLLSSTMPLRPYLSLGERSPAEGGRVRVPCAADEGVKHPHPGPLPEGEGVEAPSPQPSPQGRRGEEHRVRVTLRGLGWRNATRRRGRSLAVVGLLACAAFLVFAVGANRKDPLADATKRSSGTGGFAFYGETALPVFEDLNSPEGRKAYGLDPEVMKDVKVVPLRVHDGDDASCLNLNRAQQPRILGVNPQLLQSRRGFTFVKTENDPGGLIGWDLLKSPAWFKDWVPAVGDEATVTWGLGKAVGDDVEFTDGHGRTRTLRIVGVIANSILQGSLLIAEEQFIRLFPADEGYRAFLVDAPYIYQACLGPMRPLYRQRFVEAWDSLSGRPSTPWWALAHGLQDVGLELTPAAGRLAEFGTVENTYLSIFQALGGLAMLLGSVGLGVVVLRNVMERRNELALMRAVGFRKRALVWLVLSEHWGLLAIGLAIGTVSAAIAVLPALRSPGADVPYLSLVITLVAVAASGLVWTWLAALAALRGPLLNALRSE
ncbi:MAG: ABC transporter permease [Planctomycetes bacterium]|nr:ABC transporter permease [Planctomycetota bacterium]